MHIVGKGKEAEEKYRSTTSIVQKPPNRYKEDFPNSVSLSHLLARRTGLKICWLNYCTFITLLQGHSALVTSLQTAFVTSVVWRATFLVPIVSYNCFNTAGLVSTGHLYRLSCSTVSRFIAPTSQVHLPSWRYRRYLGNSSISPTLVETRSS